MSMIYLAAAAALLAFDSADNQSERQAILLECCDLPDKQLTLSEADLDGIVERFQPNVPVKIEHLDTPFDPLGYVRKIWREGKQLKGSLFFPPSLADFLKERGIAPLSCGLSRVAVGGPLTLSEVSLVLKPRLPAATLLSDTDAAELVRLRAENTAQRVDAQVVALKLAGKVVPATEAAARVLLAASDGATITLADGNTQSVAQAFAAYLAAQPPLVTLKEMVPDATKQEGLYGSASGDELTPDQKDWLQKSLGVDPAKVQQTIQQDKAKQNNAKATVGGRR